MLGGIHSFTSLLYGDDLVIIADIEEDLQAMLDVVLYQAKPRSYTSDTKGKPYQTLFPSGKPND